VYSENWYIFAENMWGYWPTKRITNGMRRIRMMVGAKVAELILFIPAWITECWKLFHAQKPIFTTNFGLIILLMVTGTALNAQEPTYAERLGYPADKKVLILHVDDA